MLQFEGHDAIHVGDIGLAAASDEVIVDRAQADSRVIVTLDADFHALIAVTGATSPSVIRIRIEGLRSLELATILSQVLAACEDDLNAGALIAVTAARVRTRCLPIN